jgi:hypothetical protein
MGFSPPPGGRPEPPRLEPLAEGVATFGAAFMRRS